MSGTGDETGLAAHWATDPPVKYEPKRHYNPTEDKPHSMAIHLADTIGVPELSELHEKYKNSRQRIYKFENGYGASVIQGPFSWYAETHPEALELAVLDFRTDPNGSLCFDTPVAEDVMLLDTEDELQEVLDRIAGL